MSTPILEAEVRFGGQKSQTLARLEIEFVEAGAADEGSLRFSLPGNVEWKKGAKKKLAVIFKSKVETATYKPGKNQTEILLKFGRGLERK